MEVITVGDYQFGYTGYLLRVDLTNKKTTKEEIPSKIIEQFAGARGINMKYMYDEIKPGIDPLGPENKVFFGVGPCNGTSMSGSQRFNISAKSPVTGFLGDSNNGGDLGAELKYAGYDMIIIEGQSEKPVYIYINDDEVELRDASHIWGKYTSQCRRIIEREVNDPEVTTALVGPGGENLVPFANVMTELGRSSGRTGMGAVLGSKKVKAVAVRGTRGVKVADYEALKELNKMDRDNWRGTDAYNLMAKNGVTMGWMAYQVTGMLPTRNWQRGTWEKDMYQGLVEGNFFTKQKACISCALGCNHGFVIREGPYKGAIGEGVELDHLGDFGPKIGNEDMSFALKLGNVVDDLGIDMMDSSAMIAWAMNCYQEGIITEKDADGLKLEWGDPDVILKLMEMIAYRKGFGALLAEGMKKGPKLFGKGSEKYSMHSKGLSLVMREPRASKGWALMYATSSRGACHMRAFVPEGYAAGKGISTGVFPPDALKQVEGYKNAMNAYSEEGKPELVRWYEHYRAFQDSMEICRFSLFNCMMDAQKKPILDLMVRYFNAVTGRDITPADLQHIGERIVNIERAINVREGLTRKDETLPERQLKTPLPDGPAKGQTVDLQTMLDRYYELREWDKVTGIPSRKKLEELDLGYVADDLEKIVH
jgi:aldehyde:ferredoxin oxidoreductase